MALALSSGLLSGHLLPPVCHTDAVPGPHLPRRASLWHLQDPRDLWLSAPVDRDVWGTEGDRVGMLPPKAWDQSHEKHRTGLCLLIISWMVIKGNQCHIRDTWLHEITQRQTWRTKIKKNKNFSDRGGRISVTIGFFIGEDTNPDSTAALLDHHKDAWPHLWFPLRVA